MENITKQIEVPEYEVISNGNYILSYETAYLLALDKLKTMLEEEGYILIKAKNSAVQYEIFAKNFIVKFECLVDSIPYFNVWGVI
jgi:hypothetical protein